jgi:GcrA cell cycle regulator
MDQVSPRADLIPAVDPEVEQVIKMYLEDNMRPADIATALGWTRGQVAGKLFRAGVTKRKKKVMLTPASAPRQPVNRHGYVAGVTRPLRIKSIESPKERIRVRLITDERQVTLQELKPYHCRFPIGDPKRSDFRFCGCSRVDDKKPYCAAHMTLTTQQNHFTQRRA